MRQIKINKYMKINKDPTIEIFEDEYKIKTYWKVDDDNIPTEVILIKS